VLRIMSGMGGLAYSNWEGWGVFPNLLIYFFVLKLLR
jgi:hypothetical protein